MIKNIQTAFRDLRHQRAVQGRAAVFTHRLGSFHKETAEHLDHNEAEKQTDAGDRLMVRQRMCERDSLEMFE